jgi:3-methylcrotonyl-CoA carboxylase alpha subunit
VSDGSRQLERRIAKVLIANRGEIAVRIARACREVGVATVGVASEADAGAYHARVADEVASIGPAAPSESYLRGDRLIEIALSRGCDAIHPGYGFLSESARFAEDVVEAGLVFVGPPPRAMRLMGDKTAARETMMAAGVPVVPGYQGSGDESPEALVREAERVGFPLLIKAAAGGGGKGMRIVRSPAEAPEAIESARREARKAFGDGRLFLERYVEEAHHVEVQVLADRHGQTVHLFERECSLQRRYQKILEESPSPLLDAALREAITTTAVRAAEACGYVNAGTVELLVSGADRSFYFLEMNTRLQVEHPITELVTGIDLVQAQLAIAEGRALPFRQDELTQRGHAIECRLYAEDPANGFAPSTGRAYVVGFPTGPGVRVDAGLESGDVVALHYDPMIAKLIVHAESREAALRRMAVALDRTSVLGVRTNLAFLRALLAQPAVRDGSATTTFVERTMSEWMPRADTPSEEGLGDEALAALAVAEALALGELGRGAEEGAGDGDRHSPWDRRDGYRLGGR